MTIETLADAVGVTRALYTGRSNYLFAALDWWCEQLGPSTPLLGITTEDIDDGIRVLMEAAHSDFLPRCTKGPNEGPLFFGIWFLGGVGGPSSRGRKRLELTQIPLTSEITPTNSSTAAPNTHQP
jgi:hypothetical protein